MATILLIDDDPDLIEANQAVLASRGFAVRTALSAADARQSLAQALPDLVVLDVMMETPTVGLELAREIHEKSPHLPILMLTGVREAMELPFQLGPDETWLPVTQFLEKPFTPTALADRVAAVLAGGRVDA